MTRVNIFLTIFILFASNSLNAQSSDYIYIDYAHEIMRSFIKEAKKEMGLLCYATGGSMPHDVVEIEVSFECFKLVTIEEARDLEVTATEMLRKKINEHEKIRPYLRNYPIKSGDARIKIAFLTKDGTESNDLALILPARNKLFYEAKDPVSNKFFTIFEEPYEEALKIVLKKTL